MKSSDFEYRVGQKVVLTDRAAISTLSGIFGVYYVLGGVGTITEILRLGQESRGIRFPSKIGEKKVQYLVKFGGTAENTEIAQMVCTTSVSVWLLSSSFVPMPAERLASITREAAVAE